jgi:hypothetical protein
MGSDSRSRTSDQKVEAERWVARVSARATMEFYLMLKIGLAWANSRCGKRSRFSVRGDKFPSTRAN